MIREITSSLQEQSQTSEMIAESIRNVAEMAENGHSAAKKTADAVVDLDQGRPPNAGNRLYLSDRVNFC